MSNLTKETKIDLQDYIKTGDDAITMLGYAYAGDKTASKIITRFQTTADPDFVSVTDSDSLKKSGYDGILQNVPKYSEGGYSSFALRDKALSLRVPLSGDLFSSGNYFTSSEKICPNFKEITKNLEKAYRLKVYDSSKSGDALRAGKSKFLGIPVAFSKTRVYLKDEYYGSKLSEADKLVLLVNYLAKKETEPTAVPFMDGEYKKSLNDTTNPIRVKFATQILATMLFCQCLDMGGNFNRKVDNALRLQLANVLASLGNDSKQISVISKYAEKAVESFLKKTGLDFSNIVKVRKNMGVTYKSEPTNLYEALFGQVENKNILQMAKKELFGANFQTSFEAEKQGEDDKVAARKEAHDARNKELQVRIGGHQVVPTVIQLGHEEKTQVVDATPDIEISDEERKKVSDKKKIDAKTKDAVVVEDVKEIAPDVIILGHKETQKEAAQKVARTIAAVAKKKDEQDKAWAVRNAEVEKADNAARNKAWKRVEAEEKASKKADEAALKQEIDEYLNAPEVETRTYDDKVVNITLTNGTGKFQSQKVYSYSRSELEEDYNDLLSEVIDKIAYDKKARLNSILSIKQEGVEVEKIDIDNVDFVLRDILDERREAVLDYIFEDKRRVNVNKPANSVLNMKAQYQEGKKNEETVIRSIIRNYEKSSSKSSKNVGDGEKSM